MRQQPLMKDQLFREGKDVYVGIKNASGDSYVNRVVNDS